MATKAVTTLNIRCATANLFPFAFERTEPNIAVTVVPIFAPMAS